MFTLLAWIAVAAEPANGWQNQEAVHLKRIRQLTHHFVRAGEGYFSPDGKQIIFQAEEKDTGNPFYQIFIMDLKTGRYYRVSPGVGKTTCSYFRPDGKKVIFASSHLDPGAKKHYAPEYRLREELKKAGKRRRYVWDFDPHMDIFEANLDGTGLKRLTKGGGYNAEGSYSPDGKEIVFCSNRDGNLELYIMNADGSKVRKLTNAPKCYNGGPFFSPDGKRVIFRSDRKKKEHLQLYVINRDGSGERALTDNLNWVYWAPYWYTDSKHIVYTAADHTRHPPNYDLYWMNIDERTHPVKQGRARDLTPRPWSSRFVLPTFSRLSASILYPFCTGLLAHEDKVSLPRKKVRLTYSPGADILPVFSPDGKKIMWTSTRAGSGSAQLFIADFAPPKG